VEATTIPDPAAGARAELIRRDFAVNAAAVSAMGAHYRHTTPEMAARIAMAIEQRLRLVLEVAEQVFEAQPHHSAQRVF
jgi:hypothetical protein